MALNAQKAREKLDKKISVKRPASSIKTVDAKIRRLARIIDIKNTKKKEKDDESEEVEDESKKNDEDKKEELKIIIVRPVKKITGIKALITAAATTPKNTPKINKNSLDLWAGEAVADQTSGLSRFGSLLHLLKKKQDQDELNKARAQVKGLKASLKNVQADLKARTD